MATGLGNPPPFCGVTTALITPFRDGHMDLPALEKLVDWQIVEGIHGLVVAGSTGESLSLSEAERDNLLQCYKLTRQEVIWSRGLSNLQY